MSDPRDPEPVVFQRRDFLKLVGLGVAGAAAGCAAPQDKLIPYLVPPDDVLPGIAYWYASTCRECPAGCGVMVKQREGRAIKIEGNPQHPLNAGGLCARGQAGLQGLYDPDRIKGPMMREGESWRAITWDEGLKLASERLAAARGKLTLVTAHAPGSFQRLAAEWAAAAGGSHLVYEPFAHESMREANRRTFGLGDVPHFDFARARAVVSFGADFLETWLAPVAHARGFAAMRAPAADGGGTFIAVEPRLSLTGANADEWVAVRPGGEMALALAMAHVILSENLGPGLDRATLLDAVAAFDPASAAAQTDVPAETIVRLARLFARRRPSLAVAGGVASQGEQAMALHAAVNLLNHAAGNVGQTVRFDRTHNYDAVASFADVQRLIAAAGDGQVAALVVHEANPVYAVPAWAGFAAAMDKVPFKLSLSSTMDETTARCDLVLPSLHPLESFGDAHSARGVYSLLQPAMRPVATFSARAPGESLMALARGGGFGGAFPATWLDYLKAQWRPLHGRLGAGRDFETFWSDALESGGVWEEAPASSARWLGAPAFAPPELKGAGDLALLLVPTSNLHDGRGANKSWLQELPDPTTKAVWGSWAEIHPQTAAKLGVKDGDALKVETEAGALDVPAYVYAGIRPDAVAIPLGQGHTAYGRYARGTGVNPLALLSPAQDAASGAVAYLSAKARVSRSSKTLSLVMSQREKKQADRGIAQIIPIAALMGATAGNGAHADTSHAAHAGAAAHGGAEGGHGGGHEPHPSQTRPGKHTEPLERPADYQPPAHAVTAYEPDHRARSARQNPVDAGSYKNAKHRWAMAIDLDRCNGCGACVVGCYAENNIPAVGPDLVKRGRDMAWLRIERFEEQVGTPAGGSGRNDVRFIPMLCQHCGDAPCETVCPVYATYHTPEGLNAQVYNRCVGTRYCSNNCPYKVRAFNFFDYSAPEKETFAFPEPLNWQLNPDVTVRSKGVMEKCTFCVQRVLEGKGTAKDEGRALRDGEIQTACAQSCPTQAIVFGDLMDPASRVSELSRRGERRYWVLNDLNTKPAITYLKKVERGTEA